VFFNLFFEAEPFAAVLIAHRTHGRMCQELFRGHCALVRPEGPKFEASRKRERGSWSPTERVSEDCCSYSSGVRGSHDCKCILDTL